MVSFWPWKGVDASPASFEKALAGLAAKIADTQAKLDRTRSRARRMRVLATLYLSFAYLVYAIVLVLVVGWRNLGALEWSGIAGGPLAIYTVRTVLDAYFNFRLEALAARLKDNKAEREKTIQKLKAATKYDSTLELLEKYGGAENNNNKHGDGKGKGGRARLASDGGGSSNLAGRRRGDDGGPSSSPPTRTGLLPPPTANIARGLPLPLPLPQLGALIPPPPGNDAAAEPAAELEVSAEFAPNAFGPEAAEDHLLLMQQLGSRPATANTRPATATSIATTMAFTAPVAMATVAAQPHWYDRILDLLMGEDEMAAKNRIVLVCSRCRLVNGQAPPGTRSLAEVGRWRCMGCGSSNGNGNGKSAAEPKQLGGDMLDERQRLHPPRRAAGRAVAMSYSGSELEQDDDDDTDSSTAMMTGDSRARKHS